MNEFTTKSKPQVLLQGMMWAVCAFHLATGVGLVFSGPFVDVVANLYGAERANWDPQFLYILRPMGVFMVALGVLAGVAASDLPRHRVVVYVFAGVFVARAVQRIVFGDHISELFGIDSSRNLGNLLFFFALAGVLVVLDQLSHRGNARVAPGASQSPA